MSKSEREYTTLEALTEEQLEIVSGGGGTAHISHGRTHIGTSYLGGIFNDGGGFEISPTKDGGVAILHVPPREPAFQFQGA